MSQNDEKPSLPRLMSLLLARTIIPSILGFLAGTFYQIWEATGLVVLTELIGRLDPKLNSQLLLAIGLLSLCALLLSFLLWFERPNPLKGCRFEPYGGYFVEEKTGFGVCPRCAAGSVRSYMLNAGTAFMCNVCGKSYRQPKE